MDGKGWYFIIGAAVLLLIALVQLVGTEPTTESAPKSSASEAVAPVQPDETASPAPKHKEPNIAPASPEIVGVHVGMTMKEADERLRREWDRVRVFADPEGQHVLEYERTGRALYVQSQFQSGSDYWKANVAGIELGADRAYVSTREIKKLYNDYKALFSQQLGMNRPEVSDLDYVKVYKWEWSFDDTIYEVYYQEEPNIRPLDVMIRAYENIDISRYME